MAYINGEVAVSTVLYKVSGSPILEEAQVGWYFGDEPSGLDGRTYFGLYSAFYWGIWFLEVRRVVKVFLAQFAKAHIVDKVRPVIGRDHLGYCPVVNFHRP